MVKFFKIIDNFENKPAEEYLFVDDIQENTAGQKDLDFSIC